MDIREKFDEIIMENVESSFDDLVEKVKTMLESTCNSGHILSYNYYIDMDVYDSSGLDIYYLSIAWVDTENKVHVAGASYWNC